MNRKYLALALASVGMAAGIGLSYANRPAEDPKPTAAALAEVRQAALQLAWNKIPAGDQASMCQAYNVTPDWATSSVTSSTITKDDARIFFDKTC